MDSENLALVVLFLSVFLAEFWSFGMQRAILLLSRAGNIPYEHAKMLLPPWYPAVWIIRIVKWLILIAIGFSWSWFVAAGFLIFDIIFSALVPISYHKYFDTFRKNLPEIAMTYPELAKALDGLLENVDLKGL